ncbi:hypothetical protein FQB35_04565 [Crassaminicella thermophila]|uniref:Uncharacterized protein n=1 Tax=Crassaminicella thermophila TaxID=2599308 RepID=A0A5C0SAT4_CRATE|nr:hypothetical protein [Crassaminicella thermophila]QEK11693.1 hypothetical protein FQB35_04565 [Crassaminicella thermophila]
MSYSQEEIPSTIKTPLILIKEAIFKKLSSNFQGYKLYGEEIQQGFKRPCFFVQIIPVIDTMDHQFYKSRAINIDIHYFSENETNHENLLMLDQLNDVFSKGLKVDDRCISIDETTSNTIDGVLHFAFTLNYTDSEDGVIIDGVLVPKSEINPDLGYTDDTTETMQELEIKEEL